MRFRPIKKGAIRIRLKRERPDCAFNLQRTNALPAKAAHDNLQAIFDFKLYTIDLNQLYHLTKRDIYLLIDHIRHRLTLYI